MQKFLICGLVFALFAYLANGAADVEERRLREGNSFSRKLRSCNLLCSFRGNRKSNQSICYRIPAQNAVVTDCVFRCLRLKGESPVAEECLCRNGICIEQPTTRTPTTSAPTTRNPSTQSPTTQRPITQSPTTQPPTTQPPTTQPPTTQPPAIIRSQEYKIRDGETRQKQSSNNRNGPKSIA